MTKIVSKTALFVLAMMICWLLYGGHWVSAQVDVKPRSITSDAKKSAIISKQSQDPRQTNLKLDPVSRLRGAVEGLQEEVDALKAGVQALKKENAKLKSEIQAVRDARKNAPMLQGRSHMWITFEAMQDLSKRGRGDALIEVWDTNRPRGGAGQ